MLRALIRLLDAMSPLGDLALRLWVAHVFWTSGLRKYHAMNLSQQLFENEYAVPVLSPEMAAYFAMGIELLFPVLLAIGLAGRLSAGALFFFNIAAVLFYSNMNIAGELQHLMWGVMLLIPLFRGPGQISIDHFIRRRYMP